MTTTRDIAKLAMQTHVLAGMLIEARRRGDKGRCTDLTTWLPVVCRPPLVVYLAATAAGTVAEMNHIDPPDFDGMSFHQGDQEGAAASRAQQLMTAALHLDVSGVNALAASIPDDTTLSEVLSELIACAAGTVKAAGVVEFSAPEIPDTLEGLEP